jgi:hypothetical protein
MSATTERMPREIIAYVAYLQTNVAYLLAPSAVTGFALNWNRFNWITAEMTYWQTALSNVTPFYNIYIANPKGNPVNTGKIHVIITNHHAEDKLNHSLDRIASGHPSIMVDEDYVSFHIKHNDPTLHGSLPTERTVSTILYPMFSMVGIGGGTMHYIAKSIAGSKRGKILEDHELAITYLILNETDPTPTTVDLLTQHTTSTKADNKLLLGAATSRKRIAVSMYWKHRTHTSLDGPPSPIQVIVIV